MKAYMTPMLSQTSTLSPPTSIVGYEVVVDGLASEVDDCHHVHLEGRLFVFSKGYLVNEKTIARPGEPVTKMRRHLFRVGHELQVSEPAEIARSKANTKEGKTL